MKQIWGELGVRVGTCPLGRLPSRYDLETAKDGREIGRER